MSRKLVHFASENLIAIRNAQNESMHRKDFIHDKTGEVGLQQIIDFLVNHDLIEIEQEDDVYYLTPETYDLVDYTDIEFTLLTYLGIDVPDVAKDIERELNESPDQHVIALFDRQYPTLGFKTKFIIALIVAVMIAWLTWTSNQRRMLDEKVNKEIIVPKLSEEQYEKMKKIADSIRLEIKHPRSVREH